MTSKTSNQYNRRDFLKSVGVASTVTAAACSVDPISWDPLVPQEHAYPYVIQPEQVVPGVPSFYATRCTQCESSCGMVAKSREGRIIKVDGNENDPLSKGKSCSVGQSILLENYSPDRLKKPTLNGQEIEIEQAVAQIAEKLKSGSMVWIGRHRSGASEAILNQFTSATKGKSVLWEPISTEDQAYAAKEALGFNGLPTYYLEHAKTIISFGADFLGTWGHHTMLSKGWADSRDPKVGGFVSKSVSVGPRIGMTAASSDKHLQTNPGTEAGLAFAIAKLLANKKGYKGSASPILSQINEKEYISKSGLSEELVNEVVGWLADGTVAALPGGPETSTNLSAIAIGALLINEVAGSYKGENATVRFGLKRSDKKSTAQELVDVLKNASSSDVLFIDDLDLVYHLPSKDFNTKEALAKFGAVVHFVSEQNDSTNIGPNTYVIPKGSNLETWGDAEVYTNLNVLQQPAMRPLEEFSIMSAEDVILGISKINGLDVVEDEPAAAEGSEAAAPETPQAPVLDENGNPIETEAPFKAANPPSLNQPSFYEYLKGWWESQVFPKLEDRSNGFAAFWIDSLKKGGFFGDLPTPANVEFKLAKLPALTEATGNFFVFPHPHLGAGTTSNRSWLQEIPDALSGFSWATWIEIHPKYASDLGLKKNKAAKISFGGEEIEVGWFGSPGIKEGNIAMVMGNGHENSGRYSKAVVYGNNPLKQLGLEFDASGGLRYPVVNATVAPSTNRNAPNPQNELLKSDTLTKNGRGVNFTVSHDDLGKGQEYLEERLATIKDNDVLYQNALKVEHASIVPEHHLPTDSMAVRSRHVENRYNKGATLTDMYPEPSHPTYRFAMVIDLNRCNGCGACDVACHAENNIPVVGPEEVYKGRRMTWSRLSRYWENVDDPSNPDIRFQPVMCQQCSHAPCEGVCPVLATYHNLDGLNAMVYNRCVGTRYCANNCPYTARRFNYHTYRWPESFNMMLNPDVTPREMGVMEKCTFCVQNIRNFKDSKRDSYGFTGAQKIQPTDADELLSLTACAKACPSEAIYFGNKEDKTSFVSKAFDDERAYLMLGELNNKPAVAYLARIVHTESNMHHGHHGDDHGDGHGHGDDHGHGKDHGHDKSHDHH